MNGKSPGRRLRATMAAAAAASLLLASVGSTSVAAAGPQPRGIKVGTLAQERALRYWTPKRMRTAVEHPSASLAGSPEPRGLGRPSGKAGSLPGHAPAGAKVDREAAPAEAPDPTVGYPYPYPFSRYYIDTQLYPGVYPYISVGKIFFVQNGTNYVCSGASSASGNVVFTAGHCVSDGTSTWSSFMTFVPAYENGSRPYGTFTCNYLTAFAVWHVNGDFARDTGACRVGVSNTTGKTLVNSVGWLGFAWNQSRYQHWHALGYPQASPFNGAWMTVCTASWAVTDTNAGIGSPDPHGIGCDMTGGSSGGPWVMKFKQNNWINGVNSYKYTASQPLAMYSPYFDTATNQLRCYAAAGGGAWPPAAC